MRQTVGRGTAAATHGRSEASRPVAVSMFLVVRPVVVGMAVRSTLFSVAIGWVSIDRERRRSGDVAVARRPGTYRREAWPRGPEHRARRPTSCRRPTVFRNASRSAMPGGTVRPSSVAGRAIRADDRKLPSGDAEDDARRPWDRTTPTRRERVGRSGRTDEPNSSDGPSSPPSGGVGDSSGDRIPRGHTYGSDRAIASRAALCVAASSEASTTG